MVDRLAEYGRRVPTAQWPLTDVRNPFGDQQAMLTALQSRLVNWCSDTGKWLSEHPEIALTSAVATGVVLGWLIKRR